jgi:hypothetical protein
MFAYNSLDKPKDLHSFGTTDKEQRTNDTHANYD